MTAVETEPVEEEVDQVRLNVGCGRFYAENWVNIDISEADTEEGPHPDRVASVLDLPFPDDSIDWVYLGHLLDHVDADDAPKAMAEVYRVMRPGAQLAVVGPDANRMRMGSVVLAQPDTADCRWTCTGTALYRYVAKAGFTARMVDIASVDLDPWPVVSRVWWQAAVIATKPEQPWTI